MGFIHHVSKEFPLTPRLTDSHHVKKLPHIPAAAAAVKLPTKFSSFAVDPPPTSFSSFWTQNRLTTPMVIQ